MRTIYEDDFVTEYDNGTEEVRFSDDEWAFMLKDPVYFGLAGRCGHRITESNRRYFEAEGCPTCIGFTESLDYDMTEEEMDAIQPPAPHFPLVRCGYCGDRHVGTGAVRRCGDSR